MKFYDYAPAPSPRRVRIYLAEKGIEVPIVQVDLRELKQFETDYARINPQCVVPSLELDDGTVLTESMAICRYFETLHPEPPLFGTGALEQAQVETWQRRIDLDWLANLRDALRNNSKAFMDRALPGYDEKVVQIPELAARGRHLGEKFFATLDAQLAGHEYLAGERFTVADISAFVGIGFARWVKLEIAPEQVHLRRWNEAIAARPSAC